MDPQRPAPTLTGTRLGARPVTAALRVAAAVVALVLLIAVLVRHFSPAPFVQRTLDKQDALDRLYAACETTGQYMRARAMAEMSHRDWRMSPIEAIEHVTANIAAGRPIYIAPDRRTPP